MTQVNGSESSKTHRIRRDLDLYVSNPSKFLDFEMCSPQGVDFSAEKWIFFEFLTDFGHNLDLGLNV